MNRKLKIEELGRLSADAYSKRRKFPLIIVLDNVRSAHNVGSIFRTADSFAVEEILLVGVTPTPPNREISKTALGAEETVEWKKLSTEQALLYLKSKGVSIYSLEQTTESTLLNEMRFDKDQSYALVFGNEVTGVDDELLKVSDISLEIPQFGTKHSLNVANSAAIAIWKYFEDMGA